MLGLDWRPDDSRLRVFGRVAALAFAAAGCIAVVRGSGRIVAAVCFGLGVLAVVASATRPRALLPLHWALTLASVPMKLVLGPILLVFVYFCVMTPLGLLARLVRPDPLARGFDRRLASYWHEHRPPDEVERYFRLY